MNKFYITTAIAYVNAPPHIGHALEFIQADALARYHRLKGDDTYFLTGTDEHGVKIFQTAEQKGVSTQELVDEHAENFQALEGILNLSNDDFIRTTQERHKRGAQKLWKKMVEKGDIYKDSYVGKYCVGCESFVADKDLDENGHCPNHKKPPEILEEENYFFRLSKYSDQIKKAIESDELRVMPESRKKEMLNLIGEDGLRDVSFSRPRAVLPWGIDVPDDPDQVMYVWCDALSNYVSAVDYENEGEKFKKYWPADVHLIGKDILRFHAGIWIGMLISAGVALPKTVYVHGFITSEGQKMSKSLGNVVDPLEYVDKYGVDAVRYYLLREIPTADDGDFSHQRFVDIYNSELANSLGNLVNRVVMMVDRYLGGAWPKSDKGVEVEGDVFGIVDKYQDYFDNFDIKKACEVVVELTTFTNKYIDDKKPWVMAKEDSYGLNEVLYNLLELVKWIAVLLYPILPDTAGRICKQIGVEVEDLNLEKNWTEHNDNLKVNIGENLFPRIEEVE